MLKAICPSQRFSIVSNLGDLACASVCKHVAKHDVQVYRSCKGTFLMWNGIKAMVFDIEINLRIKYIS
jgi:hypothetical protein